MPRVAGTFVDLWVFRSQAEAQGIADTSGARPETARSWYVAANRNIAFALHAGPRLRTDHPFDRCLSVAR